MYLEGLKERERKGGHLIVRCPHFRYLEIVGRCKSVDTIKFTTKRD